MKLSESWKDILGWIAVGSLFTFLGFLWFIAEGVAGR